MDIKCKDCLYYLPVDAFKGICKKTKEEVLPDQVEESCFTPNKKCKFCENFSLSTEDDQLGMCMDKFMTYPDLIGQKCVDFKQKSE